MKKKIKIAMIGLRGIPAMSGGVETAMEKLTPLLVKKGYDVTVYCRKSYATSRIPEYKGVKLVYLPDINTKYTEAVSHSFLSSLHASMKDYDIVHYHAMANALFSFFPKLSGKKTVVTLHGIDWEREKWGWLAKQYIKLGERAAASIPDATISVSEKIRLYYLEKYKKQIYFIPNGVDLEKRRPFKNLKKFGISKGKYLLFMSRLVPEKGLHFLIDAFSKTKTDMKLLIVGDATHTKAYAEQMRDLAKNDPRIIFAGPLYGDEKEEAFSNAAMFILPSTIEGLPIVLLEAMSYGLCCLTSDISENTFVTGKKGYSFKSKDSTDLKEKLEYLIKNKKERNRSGKLSKAIVLNNYKWNNVCAKTIDVYNSVLNLKNKK